MPALPQAAPWREKHTVALSGLMLVWLAAAFAIGKTGVLMNTPAGLLPPIALTAILPVAAFLAFYALSDRFRRFLLALDIRSLTNLQHWRVIGFVFFALYMVEALPALFAWPAAFGDVAIGIAAAFVVARMDRDPSFVTSPGFVRFHLLGLLDFAVAVLTAALASGALPALTGNGATSAPMDVWPLNIFPSLIVPAFIILHLIVLLKVRTLRQTAGASHRAASGAV